VVFSQDVDSGRVSMRQSFSPAGPSSVDRDPTLTKFRNLLCRLVQDLSGVG
jgi:hypothetical protein